MVNTPESSNTRSCNRGEMRFCAFARSVSVHIAPHTILKMSRHQRLRLFLILVRKLQETNSWNARIRFFSPPHKVVNKRLRLLLFSELWHFYYFALYYPVGLKYIFVYLPLSIRVSTKSSSGDWVWRLMSWLSCGH